MRGVPVGEGKGQVLRFLLPRFASGGERYNPRCSGEHTGPLLRPDVGSHDVRRSEAFAKGDKRTSELRK